MRKLSLQPIRTLGHLTRRMPRVAPILLATLLLLGSGARAHAQGNTDIIRGRVMGPDSLPMPGVVVTATSISGGVSRTGRTDRNGRYTITFPGGEGDYMITFAAVGYSPRRFELKRIADEEVLIA